MSDLLTAIMVLVAEQQRLIRLRLRGLDVGFSYQVLQQRHLRHPNLCGAPWQTTVQNWMSQRSVRQLVCLMGALSVGFLAPRLRNVTLVPLLLDSVLLCSATWNHANAMSADIPRVRLPDSLTLPQNPAGPSDPDDEEDDEADEQHVSAKNLSTLYYTAIAAVTAEPNFVAARLLGGGL